MKKLFLTLVLTALAVLSGCSTAPHKAFSEAHESASKRGIEEAKAAMQARETEAKASTSAANNCESDLCRVAIMGYANMRQMMSKDAVSAAPVIAAPVDPALRITEKLIDKASDFAISFLGFKLGLAGKSQSTTAADKDLLRDINQSTSFENPFK